MNLKTIRLTGKKRFLTPFFIVFLAFTFLTAGILYTKWVDVKNERIRDLHYTNLIIKRYYELSFNQWGNTLLAVGERVLDIQGEDATKDRQEFYDAITPKFPELLALGLANPDGQIELFSNGLQMDSLPNLALSENTRRSFEYAKQVEKISIGETYYVDHVKDWILPIRVPIRDENDSLIAVNTTALAYSWLTEDLAVFEIDDYYRIHLINDVFASTQIYFHDGQNSNSFLKRDAASLGRGEILKSRDGINYTIHYHPWEQQEVACVSASIDGYEHTLFTFVDTAVFWVDYKVPFMMILVSYAFLVGILFILLRYSSKREKRYLKELVSREANLEALFESTTSIIALFDKNKRIKEFNQSLFNFAQRVDGVTLRPGLGVSAIAPNPEMAKLLSGNLDRALQGEKFTLTQEFNTPDNQLIYFLLSYNPIYEKEEITGVSMFVEDVTVLKMSQKKLESYAKNLESLVEERTKELKKANDELEVGNKNLKSALDELKMAQISLIRSEKMASLGMLSAGIGHEINNPLNFVKNGAEAMITYVRGSNKLEKEVLAKYESIIRDGTDRISKIVNSLSHFSRQNTAMQEDCRIHDILDHCLTILYHRFVGKVEILRHYPDQDVVVKGNEGKLHQAFLNILTNAQQSIKGNGTITIRTQLVDGFAQVVITDTGAGMSKKVLSKISEPFFSTKRAGEGTGLGLFITFSIIEEHKGQISIESEVGKGTEITVKLPEHG